MHNLKEICNNVFYITSKKLLQNKKVIKFIQFEGIEVHCIGV